MADGKEGKHYDEVGEGKLIFSPNSKRMAYAAQTGDKWFVVADGKAGKHQIVAIGGGKIIFDASNNIHYLAIKDSKIYLVKNI